MSANPVGVRIQFGSNGIAAATADDANLRAAVHARLDLVKANPVCSQTYFHMPANGPMGTTYYGAMCVGQSHIQSYVEVLKDQIYNQRPDANGSYTIELDRSLPWSDYTSTEALKAFAAAGFVVDNRHFKAIISPPAKRVAKPADEPKPDTDPDPISMAAIARFLGDHSPSIMVSGGLSAIATKAVAFGFHAAMGGPIIDLGQFAIT